MKRGVYILAMAAMAAGPAMADPSPFAAGAANGSGQFRLPQEPIPNANAAGPSPAFKSLGTIPNAPTPPAMASTSYNAPPPPLPPSQSNARPGSPVPPPLTPAQEKQVNAAAGRLPAMMPPANYSPPPSDAGDAGSPPHLTSKEAMSGTIPVESAEIRARPERTYTVTVSGLAPNVFVTPFANPRLITTQPNLIKTIPHGHDIIVALSPSASVGAYITGANPTDPVVAFAFVPKKIPPRNYRIVIPGFVDNRAPAAPNKGYGNKVVAVMRDAVLNEVPADWRESKRHIPAIPTPSYLGWSAKGKWIGNRWEILEYTLINHLDKPVTLVENDFYRKGVVAVAMYPKRTLYTGSKTRLFIIEHAPASRRGLGAIW